MRSHDVRILVVEDDTIIRSLIIEALSDAGFQILEASGGEQAIRLLHDPDSVDLVVTDLNMPDVDGVAVAIEARARHVDVPVIFVTARTDLLDHPRTPLPHSRLAKPFRLSALRQAVEDMTLLL